jgi:hypothetical protein
VVMSGKLSQKSGFFKGLKVYFLLWLGVLAAGILVSAPTVLFWGMRFEASDAETYFKFAIVATHAACMAISLALSYFAATRIGLQRSPAAIAFALLVALVTAAFASPSAPVAAAVFSARSPEQRGVSRAEVALFLVLSVFVAVSYLLSAQSAR